MPTVFSVCWWCFRTMVTSWHAEKSTESTTWGIPSSVQTTSNYCWTQPSTNRWLKLENPPVPQVLVACLFDETSSIENLTIVPIWHRKKMTPSHLTVTSHQCQVHFKVSPWGGENLICFVMFFLFLLYIKPAASPTKGQSFLLVKSPDKACCLTSKHVREKKKRRCWSPSASSICLNYMKVILSCQNHQHYRLVPTWQWIAPEKTYKMVTQFASEGGL